MKRFLRITRLSILYFLTVLTVSSLPTVTRAFDTQFYSTNDILYYNPDAVAACSTDTTPGSNTVSIQDKIAQTMIAGFDTPSDATKTIVQKYKFGGVYFNGTIDGSVNKQTFDSWNSGLPSQIIVASDDEGGQIQRFLAGKKSAKEMGGMTDVDLKAYAQQLGTELADRGVTNVLAPVLDIDTGNQNAISPYDRSFSSSPLLIGVKAGDYADGLESSKIGVTFKHFPGIGKNTANTDKTYQELNMSISQLSDDLQPYKAVINKSPMSAVMLANEVLTGGWDKVDGQPVDKSPVSLNPQAVDYLRNNLSFTGVIMTDDIGVFAGYSSNKIALTDAVVRAYKAGVTMPLFRFTDENEMNSVISAVSTEVPEATINAAYQKVMSYKQTLGLKTTTTAPTTSTTQSGTSTTPAATNPTTGQPATTTTSGDLDNDVEARKQYIFQVLLGLGFTKEKAAAIWGNLYQESGHGLDPKALEYHGSGTPGYTGHGIVQWSWSRWRTDYGDSKDAMRTPNAARTADLTDFQPYPPKPPLDENTLLGFSVSQGKNWYDLGVQIQFIKKEISDGGSRDPKSYSQIQQFLDSNSTDVSALTMLWGRGYEGPSEGDANWPNRIDGANQALSQYGNLPPIDPGTGVPGSPTTGCTSEQASGGSSGGPTGDGNQFTEGLLTVPSGAYGRNVWYYNQANANLNALDSFYTQHGHTWRECACGPTTSITIVSSFANAPTTDPAGILNEIANRGGVVDGCPGQVSGIQQYFKDNGYEVVDIMGRKDFHSITKSDFDGVRKYLKQGYLVFSHTEGHLLGIYAADDSGNFYLFDPGARANSEANKAFTEEQLNSGSGMSGPAAGAGLNEFWAVKKG